MARSVYERTEYNFDLAKTERRAKVIVYCFPPAIQLMVSHYRIEIDGSHLLEVSKHSLSHIRIDQGLHSFKFFGFGQPQYSSIQLKAGDTVIFEYIGAYFIWSDGELQVRADSEEKMRSDTISQ